MGLSVKILCISRSRWMFHEFPRVGVQLTAFIQWAFCLCGWPPIFVSPFQWLHDTNQFLVLTGIEPQISYTTIKDFTSFYNNLTIKSWWIWILRYFRRFQNIFICHCSDLLYVLSGEIIQIRDVPLKNIKKYHLN